MRPPVASLLGESPLRGKNANKIIDLARDEVQDASGYRLTKEQVAQHYTDDARL